MITTCAKSRNFNIIPTIMRLGLEILALKYYTPAHTSIDGYYHVLVLKFRIRSSFSPKTHTTFTPGKKPCLIPILV